MFTAVIAKYYVVFRRAKGFFAVFFIISADTEDEILTDDHLNIVKFLSRISDLGISKCQQSRR